MKTMDLNADVGEGFDTDPELMELISSASIACGGHAGSPETMHSALLLAKKHGVSVGAHPGFEDKENFGRLRLKISHQQINAQIFKQITTLLEIAVQVGVPVKYVKLHGALANMAAEDDVLATDIFSAIREISPKLGILALDNSAQVNAAKNLGFRVIREAYADRRYDEQGLLLSRSEPNAVLTGVSEVLGQCLRLAKTSEIVAVNGTVFTARAQSLCLHGDTPGAVSLATNVAEALDRAHIDVKSVWE